MFANGDGMFVKMNAKSG